MSYSSYLKNNFINPKNKKIIITGANSGIGFECAKILAMLDAKVFLACRSFLRATKARNKILKEKPDAQIFIIPFDQSNQKSCDDFVELLSKKHFDFDAILFNAGIFAPKKKTVNKKGVPITIEINTVNIAYIISKIKPLLDKADKEKIISFQCSLASSLANKKYSLFDNNLSAFKQYALSKYGLFNYFKYLASSNSNDKVKYLCCEPGVTNSNIIRDFPSWIRKLGNGFLKLFMMKTNKAALTGVASLIGKKNINGMIYVPKGLFRVWGYPKGKVVNINKYDKNIVNTINKLIYGK